MRLLKKDISAVIFESAIMLFSFLYIFLSNSSSFVDFARVGTVCLFADKEYQFVSSSMVKEVLNFDKDISKYVDSVVKEKMLIKKKNMEK